MTAKRLLPPFIRVRYAARVPGEPREEKPEIKVSTVRKGKLDLGRMLRRKQTRHEISHLKK